MASLFSIQIQSVAVLTKGKQSDSPTSRILQKDRKIRVAGLQLLLAIAAVQYVMTTGGETDLKVQCKVIESHRCLFNFVIVLFSLCPAVNEIDLPKHIGNFFKLTL